MPEHYRPPDRAGDYRRHARGCIEAALHASDENACAAFLELAFSWTRLAQRLEASERDAGDDFGAVQVVIIKPRRH